MLPGLALLREIHMIDRRMVVLGIGASLSGATLTSQAARADNAASKMTAYRFSFPALAGEPIRLADFAGKPVLVVNTASQCGYTPQYTGLQKLWSEFHERGLTIIAVPSNDFNQEPGIAGDIAEQANKDYGVTFPMTAKAVVTGSNAHPFYRWAAEARPKETPRWNFHKYLIGRDGYIADVFASSVEPTDTRVKTAVARLLANG